jgi:hypothetical protein
MGCLNAGLVLLSDGEDFNDFFAVTPEEASWKESGATDGG